MKDASGSRHKSCYLQCRPNAVSRWRVNPRHWGPRRLIARPPAAGATHSALRRPGALKITASCVLPPGAVGTFTAKLAPAPQCQLQCPRQPLLHPSCQPLSPLHFKTTSGARGKQTINSPGLRAPDPRQRVSTLWTPQCLRRYAKHPRFQVFCRFVLPLLNGGPVSRPFTSPLHQGAKRRCPLKTTPAGRPA